MLIPTNTRHATARWKFLRAKSSSRSNRLATKTCKAEGIVRHGGSLTPANGEARRPGRGARRWAYARHRRVDWDRAANERISVDVLLKQAVISVPTVVGHAGVYRQSASQRYVHRMRIMF